tara:strand:+ start:50571 stop:51212 length:642 start_codon:yes stop_codon:yes gene_type:complete
VPGAEQEKVVLRLQGTEDTTGIPAVRTDVVSMQVRFVELAPSIKLSRGGKYEVVVGSGTKARVISTFTVSGKADTSVPKTPKVKKATFFHEEAVCCTCGSGKPHIQISLVDANEKEDLRILYGIWNAHAKNANAKGEVDWNRNPDAYVVSWYGTLSLGDASTCTVNNFPIAPKGKMKFGIRAISAAGTQSKGEIVTVKVKAKTKSRFLIRKQK